MCFLDTGIVANSKFAGIDPTERQARTFVGKLAGKNELELQVVAVF